MKIAHFHPNYHMAEKFVAPLMLAEREAGHQTQLITSSGQASQEGTVLPFDLTARNLIGLPLTLLKTVCSLRRMRSDVIFSHNTKSSLIPLISAWLARIPVRVYYNHGVPHIGYRAGPIKFLLLLIETWNLKLATHVITVSTDMVKSLQNINPQIKITMINNGSACGIDLEEFSSENLKKYDWRNSQGIAKDDFIVTYIGRPKKRKGFDFSLHLWVNHFNEEHFKLVLCGPEIDDALKHLKSIPSNVICLGFIHNIPEILSGSDLIIFPSLHEGLSYACLEAQAAGRVVIANNIPGLRCLITNGVNGFLVNDNNPLEYIKIIREVKKNKKATEGIQQAAKKSASRYSRKIFMPSYLEFLSTL